MSPSEKVLIDKGDRSCSSTPRAISFWLSRVLECLPGASIRAELDINPDNPIFKGHFPQYPVFPGVLLMEALAQASSFCILVDRGEEGAFGFLTGIDKAKFRQQVKPGDVVELTARIVKSSSRMCVAEVEARVDGRVCASAVQRYVLSQGDANATS